MQWPGNIDLLILLNSTCIACHPGEVLTDFGYKKSTLNITDQGSSLLCTNLFLDDSFCLDWPNIFKLAYLSFITCPLPYERLGQHRRNNIFKSWGATHTRERSDRVGEGVGGVSPSHGLENFSFSRTLK